MPKNTDQIRRLTNTFSLAGPIAEIVDFKEGKTKDNVPYISFIGTIRCGDGPIYDQRFRIFSTAKKKDMATGELVDRPNYKKLRDWCKECVSLTKNPEEATWAELTGFFSANDYVNVENKLVEGYQFNVTRALPFADYKAEINLEGLLHSTKEETRGDEEEPTGRLRLRIVSTDFYGNAVDMKICKADPDISQQLEENGYGSGSLATYYISLVPSVPAVKVAKGGIGQQRTTTGRSFIEYMVVGASAIIEDDSKDYIEPSVFKKLMAERKNHLKEIEEAGYQGKKETSADSSNKGVGVGKTNSSAKKDKDTEEDEDEDMPF